MTKQSDIKTLEDLEKFIKVTPGAMRVANLSSGPDWDPIFEHLHTHDGRFVIEWCLDSWYVIPWQVAVNHLLKNDYDGEKITWAQFWGKYGIGAPIETLFDVQVPIIPGLKLVWGESVTNTLQGILAGAIKSKEKAPKLSIEKLHQYFMMSKAFKTLLDGMGSPVDLSKK
ncbi:hypothetical protein BNJ_00406 [Kaumoebavirus]|uniref:hypothetical protein n=1 Tax=Kaumoebavirus TaxID=1859492 RepID=UPI0009C26DC4|nr:hypothetical protein BNJ_00406 [Kaumoebavirus]ARA72224.1 hypothetical protein BNJ_00406 [Kaumoebavirus]